MPVSKAAERRILRVIASICTIKKLGWYCIGFSSAPSTKRAADVERVDYTCFVVLADRLTRKDALDLEKRLFEATTKVDKKGLLYRKYAPSKRDGRYFPSYGGNKKPPNAKVHSVYMDWWTKK